MDHLDELLNPDAHTGRRGVPERCLSLAPSGNPGYRISYPEDNYNADHPRQDGADAAFAEEWHRVVRQHFKGSIAKLPEKLALGWDGKTNWVLVNFSWRGKRLRDMLQPI